MPLHIALAVAPGEPPNGAALAVRLCDVWKKRGHQVSVTSAPYVDADCVLLHIDTTIIKPELIPVTRPNTLFLNKNVTDISKRRISRNLVSHAHDYNGPVIVKTNGDFFGLPVVPQNRWHRTLWALRKTATPKTWRYLRMLPQKSYPILKNKSEVPAWVWRREDIVVERFMAEIDDGLYVLRLWVFLGTREYGVKLYARSPIVKSNDIVRYEYLTEVPDKLRQERQRLGFDFGKFDYVLENGVAQLLDANATPTIYGGHEPSPNLLNLADALSDMFPGRG
jgi:hypothetical protein